MNERYGSRKFIVTTLSVILTSVLAYTNHMDANVAMVMSAAIVSYNIANAWQKQRIGE